MNTLVDMAACVSDLRSLRKLYRVLPHGVAAMKLRVSRYTLFDLIRDGYVQTEPYFGGSAVLVDSLLKYAKARHQRALRRKKMPARQS